MKSCARNSFCISRARHPTPSSKSHGFIAVIEALFPRTGMPSQSDNSTTSTFFPFLDPILLPFGLNTHELDIGTPENIGTLKSATKERLHHIDATTADRTIKIFQIDNKRLQVASAQEIDLVRPAVFHPDKVPSVQMHHPGRWRDALIVVRDLGFEQLLALIEIAHVEVGHGVSDEVAVAAPEVIFAVVVGIVRLALEVGAVCKKPLRAFVSSWVLFGGMRQYSRRILGLRRRRISNPPLEMSYGRRFCRRIWERPPDGCLC